MERYSMRNIEPAKGESWMPNLYKNISLNRQTLKQLNREKQPSRPWVDHILKESNIKLNNYEIKDDNRWAADNHTLYLNRKEDEYYNQYALKHEVKHLKNKDVSKAAALGSGTVGLATFFIRKKPVLTIPVILAGYTMNMAYWRYIEEEADRFAYEHATCRKEIEAGQQDYLNQIQSDMNDVFALSDAIISLENKLNTQPLTYYDYIKEKSRLNFFKSIVKNPDISVDILHCINDRAHPSPKKRVAIAQEYLDQWERD